MHVRCRSRDCASRRDSAKEWRDVFHHDSAGKVIGWTRHGGDKATEFTAAGHQVLEKDSRGRPVKARTVDYALDETIKPPSVRPLKLMPGKEFVYYEYQGDDDREGRVARREPAEAK